MPIEVILTDRLRDAIEEVFGLDSTTNELKNELQMWRRSGDSSNTSVYSNNHVDEVKTRNCNTIPFKSVKKVFETLKKAGKVIYLNELMEGSGLYIEPIHEAKKSPELVARLEKLQAKQNELRYRAMVKNVDKELLHKEKKAVGLEIRSTSRQLTSVRVMFGLILACAVAVAELYFMAKGAEI
ncbi:transmembrane protein 199-like isoform X2 [Dendronephthya gigantea]|uniref:transmembrane protein 199-like isoform X2 n=1 Tax=Dendronephthya gigantea TaxID=151771 RepID=UPI00106C7CDB|nr:transmembrane protein 199-like isoform X2 [Dendronephthya gigantea]